MDNYRLIQDIGSLMRRVDYLEMRLEDIDEYELPALFSCEQGEEPLTMEEEIGEIDKKTFTWPRKKKYTMERKFAELNMYSTGLFHAKIILINHSNFQKYGNNISFRLKYKDRRNYFCTITSFSENFNPGQEKTLSDQGVNECIKNNFELIMSGKVVPTFYWHCWKRG